VFAFQDDFGPGVDQVRHHGGEMDLVADPLFAPHQNRLAVHRLAGPRRLWERAGCRREVPAPPPLPEFLPALIQAPGQQQHVRQVAVRLGVFGVDLDGAAKGGQGLFQVAMAVLQVA